MRVIPVDVYPLTQTYDSFRAAVEGARSHPLQAKARTDTAKLSGASLIDACWTDTDFVLRLSSGLLLGVYVQGEKVTWEVADALPGLDESAVERVGSSPVLCRWRPGVGDYVMDRSALVSKRRGSVLERLFVNEFGLLVYCRGHMILWFQAVCRTDLGRSFLWVTEDD